MTPNTLRIEIANGVAERFDPGAEERQLSDFLKSSSFYYGGQHDESEEPEIGCFQVKQMVPKPCSKRLAEKLKREQEEQKPKGSKGGQQADPGVTKEDMRKDVEESRRQLERLQEKIDKMQAASGKEQDKLQQSANKASEELAKLEKALEQDKPEEAEGANARAQDQLRKLEGQLDKMQGQRRQQRNADGRSNELIIFPFDTARHTDDQHFIHGMMPRLQCCGFVLPLFGEQCFDLIEHR